MRNLYNITITIRERIFHSIIDSSSIDSVYSSVRNSINRSIYYSLDDTFIEVAQFSFSDKILSQSKHSIRKLNKNFKKN
jgi:hypothetical protein